MSTEKKKREPKWWSGTQLSVELHFILWKHDGCMFYFDKLDLVGMLFISGDFELYQIVAKKNLHLVAILPLKLSIVYREVLLRYIFSESVVAKQIMYNTKRDYLNQNCRYYSISPISMNIYILLIYNL